MRDDEGAAYLFVDEDVDDAKDDVEDAGEYEDEFPSPLAFHCT